MSALKERFLSLLRAANTDNASNALAFLESLAPDDIRITNAAMITNAPVATGYWCWQSERELEGAILAAMHVEPLAFPLHTMPGLPGTGPTLHMGLTWCRCPFRQGLT